MTIIICKALCLFLWLFFFVFWIRASIKIEVKRRGVNLIPLPFLIICVFVLSFTFPFGWSFSLLSILGLLTMVFGFVCSLWAKGTLGDSWSRGNKIRYGHLLMKEIPYSSVRHPFYLAVIIMIFGSSLVFGSFTMFGASILLSIVLSLIAFMEERLLIEEFGQEYINYQEEVPFLIPRYANILPGIINSIGKRKDDVSEDEIIH